MLTLFMAATGYLNTMTMQQVIKEDLLHYVWKTKQINHQGLTTTDDLRVEIVDWGTHNHDSGPDFFNGKIVIDGTLWVGNIEMHIFSSDWHKHSHDSDPAYDNVILHVVYETDGDAYTAAGSKLHCVEIKDRIPDQIKANYSSLLQAQYDIPCQSLVHTVDEFTISMWKDRLIADRLEHKSQVILRSLADTTYDWDTTTYITLVRYMGSKVNGDAFEAMARALPLTVILKCNDSLLKVESLLYGVAGMLEASYDDPYYRQLQAEYRFQSQKYKLQHIPPVMWKFSKMRPANFPTVRLAQLAQILFHTQSLFSRVLDCGETYDLRQLFSYTASQYWDNHYRFGKEAAKVYKKTVTPAFIDLLLINVVAPLLFRYSLQTDQRSFADRAVALLSDIKSESNAIVSKWRKLGLSSSTALDSQALIHLKKQYCDHKKCLSCNIGNKIVLNTTV